MQKEEGSQGEKAIHRNLIVGTEKTGTMGGGGKNLTGGEMPTA